jgi:hypothetical protein
VEEAIFRVKSARLLRLGALEAHILLQSRKISSRVEAVTHPGRRWRPWIPSPPCFSLVRSSRIVTASRGRPCPTRPSSTGNAAAAPVTASPSLSVERQSGSTVNPCRCRLRARRWSAPQLRQRRSPDRSPSALAARPHRHDPEPGANGPTSCSWGRPGSVHPPTSRSSHPWGGAAPSPARSRIVPNHLLVPFVVTTRRGRPTAAVTPAARRGTMPASVAAVRRACPFEPHLGSELGGCRADRHHDSVAVTGADGWRTRACSPGRY